MEVYIKVMNDDLFSDDSRGREEILMSLAAHSQYFSPVVILSYICPLIHNILRPLSSHVEIADSISLPVEVNNSTIELYLPVDSQYSSPVEGLNLIVE